MSDRESMLMDRLLTEENRAEAAEAREARLREALEMWLEPYEGWSNVELCKRTDPATERRIIISRQLLAALSDAAQPTTTDYAEATMGTVEIPMTAAQMRERAAKYVDEQADYMEGHDLANGIRALPLEASDD